MEICIYDYENVKRSDFKSYVYYLHIVEERLLNKKIVEMLKPYAHSDMKVLEVGCKDGFNLLYRAKKLGLNRLYGVEIVEESKEKAQENGIIVHKCDLEDEPMPFEDEFFDLIIFNQVMEHLKKIHRPMDECYRVLKDNGLILVSVPNLASLHNRYLLLFGRQPTTLSLFSEHVRGFTPSAFLDFLQCNSKLKLLNYKSSGFYPFPPPMSVLISNIFPGFGVFQLALLKKHSNTNQSWVEIFKSNEKEGGWY